MVTTLKKPLFWISVLAFVGLGLVMANYALGFWPFTSPKVKVIWSEIENIPADCGKGYVLQSINPRICVSLLTGTAAPSGSTRSSGPGCTGNVGASGPGLT